VADARRLPQPHREKTLPHGPQQHGPSIITGLLSHRFCFNPMKLLAETRSICLHENMESHVVNVQSPRTPVLFLDSLSLPYADESPADQPPTTSGCHISISGQSEWSMDEPTLSGSGSGGIATPASDVSPPPAWDAEEESRDRVGSLMTRVTSHPVRRHIRCDVILVASDPSRSRDSSSNDRPEIEIWRPKVLNSRSTGLWSGVASLMAVTTPHERVSVNVGPSGGDHSD